MKRHTRILIATLLVMAILTLSACAGPSQRWGALTITYTKALNGASDLRRQGFIDDDEYLDIEAVREPISMALDAAHDQIVGGEDAQAQRSLDRAADFLDELAALLAASAGE